VGIVRRPPVAVELVAVAGEPELEPELDAEAA